MAETTDRVNTVWHWCRDAYLRITGRRLNLPRDTDPTKTYQWRYLEALSRKLEDWGLDDGLCRVFIDVAVRYARDRHLLGKGLSIFLQSNLLQECYLRLREQASKDDDALAILGRTRAWLDREAANAGRAGDLVSLLLHRTSIGAYPNIIRWYQGGQLPEIYLAISRSCGIVISKLTGTSDRELLPKDARLFLTQSAVLRGARAKFDIRMALRDDWRRPCR